MRIIHVTLGIPELRSGGLISYAYSLAETQGKLGHDVFLIYPGNYNIINKKMRIVKKKQTAHLSIYKLVNPSFVSVPLGIKKISLFMKTGNRNIYKKFLNDINPDLIHIHTFMGFHKEFFEIIKSYDAKVLYTTHDYYSICPKTNRVDENNHICISANAKHCAICNLTSNNSMLIQHILQSEWYPRLKKNRLMIELKKRRKISHQSDDYIYNIDAKTFNKDVSDNVICQYKKLLKMFNDEFSCIDIVHCNSSVTKYMYSDYLRDKKYFVLNITSNGINDNRNKVERFFCDKEYINIGFIGIRNFHKGYWILKKAGEILYNKGYKFKISFYGDEFNIDQQRYPYCYDKGMFSHNQLNEVMGSIDLMVVPSFCYETFGFSTLEAVANNVPVLVSSHTGSKDILKDISLPHIFEPNPLDLANLLEIYLKEHQLLEQLYKEQKELKLTFNMNEHVKKLLEIIGELDNL